MTTIDRNRRPVKSDRPARPFAEGLLTETEALASRKARVEPTLGDRSWAAATSPFADSADFEPGTLPPISGGAPENDGAAWDRMAAESFFMDRHELGLS